MSITVTTDVFCDLCGDWHSGVSGTKPQAKDARRSAKHFGWIYKKDEVDGEMQDICPKCQSGEGSEETFDEALARVIK